MTLDALIMLAGAVVALVPFLGFPLSWAHAVLFIVGMCVIALGIVVRRRLSQRAGAQKFPFDGGDTEER